MGTDDGTATDQAAAGDGTLLGGDTAQGGDGGGSGDSGTPADGSTDGGGGNTRATGADATQDWRQNLGDLASHEKLNGIDSVEALAKAYVETKPAAAVPEKYTTPEAAALGDDVLNTFKTLGLSQEQVDGLVKLNSTKVSQAIQAAEALQNRDLDALKTEWGEGFTEKLTLARQAIAKVDENGKLKEYLNKTRAGNNPVVIRALAAVGELLKEGGFIASESHQRGTGQKSLADRIYPNQGKES